MVSGLVTSPWDHERIFSGLAREMRMESKSAIKLARSYGLLRYKVVSSLPSFRQGCGPYLGGPAENPKNQLTARSCQALPGLKSLSYKNRETLKPKSAAKSGYATSRRLFRPASGASLVRRRGRETAIL